MTITLVHHNCSTIRRDLGVSVLITGLCLVGVREVHSATVHSQVSNVCLAITGVTIVFEMRRAGNNFAVALATTLVILSATCDATTYVKSKPIGIHFDVEPYTLPEWDNGR